MSLIIYCNAGDILFSSNLLNPITLLYFICFINNYSFIDTYKNITIITLKKILFKKKVK